ncbi:ATP/DNA binding protein [Rhynchospora pubera]|uniref:ATP/DNA binding protein n=1 Tax=Rhynchospora pubera TaxID=906938 RepID=A0AAV8DIB5_9POAL|nr:ATP/DNA binding protein [Rhynchospora pubera]
MKCQYYMWRQSFPVDPQSKTDGRKGVDMWNISLAFPLGERLNRRTVQAGIYAFLPTTMVTNFPFIIHSDFILASSRETILLDNEWNLGILDCVGHAFVQAFHSYVTSHSFPEITKMLQSVPVHESSFPVLNNVREDIKELLKEKAVLPCENYSMGEKIDLCKPGEAVRLLPAFRKILNKAKEGGLSLENDSLEGRFILHNLLESKDFDGVLKYLGVCGPTDFNWYNCCIKRCDLAVNLCHDTYVDLICFMMDYTKSYKQFHFKPGQIPLRHVKHDTSSSNMFITMSSKVWYIRDTKLYAWLYRWNQMFGSQTTSVHFMPAETQIAFAAHNRGNDIVAWLCKINRLEFISLEKFVLSVCNTDAKKMVHLACFLYFTHVNNLTNEHTLRDICRYKLPVVDSCGSVHVGSKKILLPASRSNWGKLFNHVNPFLGEKYIAIGEIYAEEREVNGNIAPKDSVLNFLIDYTGALDLPLLQPPDVDLPILYLTSEQAFLLLNWVKQLSLSYNMGTRFGRSVRCGRWVKTISGFDKPENCFLANGSKSSLIFQITQSLPGFAVIDEQYYQGRIASYGDALKQIGVTLATDGVSYTAILQRFVSLAEAKKMSNGRVLALLKLIKHLKKVNQLGDHLLDQLKEKSWLVTSQGLQSPPAPYFIRSEHEAILQTVDIPLIDEGFYGPRIGNYEPELILLGVEVNIEQVFRQIPLKLRFPADASLISREGALFLLKSIRKLGESELEILEKIKSFPWIKTVAGYKFPQECILYDMQWGLLPDFGKMPVIEEAFYGDAIRSFVMELKAIGVAVDLSDAEKKITDVFKSLLSSSTGPTCRDVAMMLSYIKGISEKMSHAIPDLVNCFSGIRFLKTRHGFRCPSESILFDSKWGTICTYVDLPLIDDGFHGIDIYSYRNELECLGAVVDFSEGPHFVAAGLRLPKEPPGFFSAEAALMLLHCTGLLMKRSSDSALPEFFLAKIRDSAWLKTHVGYKSPKECIFIQSSWQSLLKPLNGPFIDEVFYGSCIYLYGDQLKAIGAIVETHDVCFHVYTLLLSQHDNRVISPVLGYLEKNRWKPTSEAVNLEGIQLWLPERHSTEGKWVPRNLCVLHDRDNLFSANNQPLHFLDKHYNKKMLQYFSCAFGIPHYPSIDAYLSLWCSWEVGGHDKLALQECCAFWEYAVANWDQHSNMIKEKIKKVPCTCTEVSAIQLVDIENSALPDDLELKKLFTHSNEEALFVWYPFEDSPTIPLRQLFEIYCEIGVKRLSEMVTSSVSFRIKNRSHEDLALKDGLIVAGLLKILLGFLAGPRIRMPLRKRHEAVLAILNLKFRSCDEPVMLDHVLVFPSCKDYYAKGRRVVFFDKAAQTLFVHRGTFEKRHTSIEFMTYFARAISSILPLDMAYLHNDICRLIQTGIISGFEEDAVKFILETENLHVFREDEEFVSTLFSTEQSLTPSLQLPTPSLRKPRRGRPSSPPCFSQKKRRSLK